MALPIGRGVAEDTLEGGKSGPLEGLLGVIGKLVDWLVRTLLRIYSQNCTQVNLTPTRTICRMHRTKKTRPKQFPDARNLTK